MKDSEGTTPEGRDIPGERSGVPGREGGDAEEWEGSPRCIVDYLSCTLPPGPSALEQAKRLFGGDDGWRPSGPASWRRGKVRMCLLNNRGVEQVCVTVKSEGCRELEALGLVYGENGWRVLLGRLREMGCRFPRIDFAFDDVSGALSLPTMRAKVDANELTTRFRRYDPRAPKNLNSGKLVGETLYFGTRSSGQILCIYDKAAERKARHRRREHEHWVRVELRAHNAQANALVDAFVACGPAAIAGHIRAQLEFREPSGDSNRSRWPVSPWWSTFLGDCERVRVPIEPASRTLEQMRDVFRHQQKATLAMLCDRYGDEFVREIIANGRNSLTPTQRALLQASKREEQARRNRTGGIGGEDC